MSYATIAGQIKTMVEGLPGFVNVYDYQPSLRDLSKYLAYFKDPNGATLEGWVVTRSGLPIKRLTNVESTWSHNMVIRGYFGVEEARQTDKLFQAKIDQIAALFDSDTNLSGLIEETNPPQGGQFQQRIFGGALVHYAEFTLVCRELVVR